MSLDPIMSRLANYVLGDAWREWLVEYSHILEVR